MQIKGFDHTTQTHRHFIHLNLNNKFSRSELKFRFEGENIVMISC